MNSKYFLPLIINLTGELRHHYKVDDKLPAHNLVLGPLLKQSNFAFIYGLKKNKELLKKSKEILIYENGKYKFDTSKECISGFEELWNSTGWKRGSIVLSISSGKVNWKNILKNTYRPAFTETPNSGNSASAIKLCKSEMENGNVAICIPASNGIEWMTIYAKQKSLNQIHKIAIAECKEANYYETN